MSHIYLTSDDLKVGLSQGRVVVKRRDANEDGEREERSIPLSSVDSINVFGGSQLSTQLIRQCLVDGVPVGYFSEDGHYYGRISAFAALDPDRQKRQIGLTDNVRFCLEWSKRIVAAKILNSKALLSSMDDVYVFTEEKLRGLDHSLKSLDVADSVDMVLGFEGNAAKSYFQCLPNLVSNEEFAFQGRSARPPKDPMNAMLSYGYSLLQRNIVGAIERHGLHPYFTYMHKIKRGHAALASDLIEELRAPFVDRTVLTIANSGEIAACDFEKNEKGGVYMSRTAMKRLTNVFTDAMGQRCCYFAAYGDAKKYSFQSMLDKKICSVIDAIEKQDAQSYMPVLWEGVYEDS